jgi:alanyl-tRNA synthetase
MTLPAADTDVTYPDGDTTSTGTVLHVEPLPDGRVAVLTDRTAFHPVDRAWPDQPSDRGVLVSSAGAVPVEAVTAGVTDGRLLVGEDLPVRLGTPGWTFVVAHLVAAPGPVEGEAVRIEADAAHRLALSSGHTACHLAALALDAALADRWTKPAAEDALGSPAFDALAIQRSVIEPFGSTDVYRIGRSLRKKGFDPAAFDDPDDLAGRIDAHLARWVAEGAPVRIDREDAALSSRRTWTCALRGGTAAIPCGGTHVRDVAELGRVAVTFDVERAEGALQVTMTTRVG